MLPSDNKIINKISIATPDEFVNAKVKCRYLNVPFQ